MNFRDFEIARNIKRRNESHQAILRKRAKRPLARPKASKNIFSNDPRMQGI